MTTRCRSCGGVYERLLADGTEYYHVCPPITLVAVLRNGQRQRVPLRLLEPTDSVRVQRGTNRVTVLVSDVQPDDLRLGDTTRERGNARDERPVRRRRGNVDVTEPTAEGAGVDTVARPDPADEDVFAQ